MQYVNKKLIDDIACIRVNDPENNGQIFDFQLFTQGYYRLIIMVNYDEGLIDVKSNIKEINEETLFDIETEDEALDAILTQADFIFANFIFMELFHAGKEIMVATEYIDIKHLENEIVAAQTQFNSYVEQAGIDEVEDFDSVMAALDNDDVKEIEERISRINEEIDEIFISSMSNEQEELSFS